MQAVDSQGNGLDVGRGRNVNGRGYNRGGQSADDEQAVEWKGYCKRSFREHRDRFVWIIHGRSSRSSLPRFETANGSSES